MSWQAVSAAKRHRVGSATWKAVLLVIADHCGPDGTGCTARYATIAEEAECSLRVVKTIVPALLAAGVLKGRTGRLAVEMDDVVTVTKSAPPALSAPNGKVHLLHPEVHVVHPESAPSAPPSKPTPNRPTTDPDFDAFWAAYPRHASKGAAKRAWATAVKRAPVAELIAGAERYRDDPKRNPDFTKHPATWLNGECWADEPARPSPHRQARVSHTGAVMAPGVEY